MQGNPIILGCGFDIGKCLCSLACRDAVDGAEARNGAADMPRVGERLFALAWKGESACGKAPAREAWIGDRLPGDTHASYIARMYCRQISEVMRA